MAGDQAGRPFRFRLRTRSMMAAVALVAVLMGGWRTIRLMHLADHYRAMARSHRARAAGFQARASDPRTPPGLAGSFRYSADRSERWAARFGAAAARPWLPLTPPGASGSP